MSSKAVEMNPKIENTIRTQVMALKTVRGNKAVVRQLQGELADTQRKLATTEALLQVESHHHMCSQYKILELKKELDESRRQSQHEKEGSNALTCNRACKK